MTQIDTIKSMLSENAWVCGTVFQAAFIPEYRTRISELRKSGYNVITRPCQIHNHKSKNLQEWRIAPKITLPPAFPVKVKVLEPVSMF